MDAEQTSGEGSLKKNLALLFALQALNSTTSVALLTVNGLVGLRLAPHPQWATLPITAYVVGSAVTTFLASVLMARFGRGFGFRLGSGLALLGALISGYGVSQGRFWVLCAGSVLLGAYAAFSSYARFAAAEASPPSYKAKAVSWVMTAGIVGAVLGPESTKWTKGWLDAAFVGTYASLALLALVSFVVTLPLTLPLPERQDRSLNSAAVLRVLGHHDGRTAIVCAVVGYAAMVFLMTATPLAMDHHHHAYEDTALVIEWHVLGMYAPSFVTGALISRFGVVPILLAGCALMFACVGINLAGTSVTHFFCALVLLGVGWNFMFVGGTTLLVHSFDDRDKAVAQGLNEALVFGVMAVASASSGSLIHQLGWRWSNLAVAPFILLPVALAAQLWRRRRVKLASA